MELLQEWSSDINDIDGVGQLGWIYLGGELLKVEEEDKQPDSSGGGKTG